MLTDDFKNQLVEKLKELDPYKIIVFGSQAHGVSHQNSDLDLLVVTGDDFLPKDFAEKNAVYLKVASAIVEFEKKFPIDLIVHTKAMHAKFVELGGMFARQIAATGAVLYEKT